MVNSIHHADRIGVISPPRQLRKVGHRNHPKKDSREDGGTESQTAEDESRAEEPDTHRKDTNARSENKTPLDNPNSRQTGRRIDVMI